MSMHRPVHPGSIVREDCIEPSGLTVAAAAKQLGVTRQALSNLINEKSAVSAEMALRLESVGWGTAETWVRLQGSHDLSRARERWSATGASDHRESGVDEA